MFSFLNPIFLWGAVGAAVPIFVHLIHRRRTRTVRFALMEFLLQSQKRKSRRFKLKEWLLLAIRTAMILCLVGLGAHPVVTQAADTAGRAYPSHLVAIVDTSMSMRFAGGDGTRFDTAKAWLKSLLAPMRGTNVAVLSAEANASGLAAGVFSPGPEEAVRALDDLRPAYGEADVLGAFQRAFGMLRAFPGGLGGGKEILFLTDGAANGWKAFSVTRLKKVDLDVKMRVIRWGRKGGDPNVAVDRVGLAEHDAVAGMAATLRARVRNYGPADRTVPVELWTGGGKIEERSVRVPAGGRTEVAFKTRIKEAGYLPGRVQIRSGGLKADDAFYFALFVRDRPRGLLVDGDPKTSLLGSETFYLMNALSPRRGLGVSPFRTRWIPARALTKKELAGTDVLVLANVAAPSRKLSDALAEFVRKGGGLLLFMGDRVSTERYDALLWPAGLLPARLLEVRESADREAGEEVGAIDLRHPALRIFTGLGAASFAGSRFKRWVGMVEAPAADVLMRLKGGAPLLVEAGLGKGRVMAFASTADRDWNDFSIRVGYLPFLQNLFLYLGCRACPGGEMPEGLAERVTVGETWTHRAKISFAGTAVSLSGPAGLERALKFSAGEGDDAGRAVVRYRAAGDAGIYHAKFEGAGIYFTVNPPPAESDLTPLPDEELKAKFGDFELDAPWREDIPGDYNPWRRSRTDFTGSLVWLLLGLAAAEVVLAGRQ